MACFIIFAEENVSVLETALLLLVQVSLTQSRGHNWKPIVCISYAATKLIPKSFVSGSLLCVGDYYFVPQFKP